MHNDSKWDYRVRDCQIEVLVKGHYFKEVDVPEKRIFGFVLRRARKKMVKIFGPLSTSKGDVIPDDVEAIRKFKHSCRLIKATEISSGNESKIMLILDGLPGVALGMSKIEFRLDSELENGPVAEIVYEGSCTRYGRAWGGDLLGIYASLVFKDQDQMKKFVAHRSLDHRSSGGNPTADCYGVTNFDLGDDISITGGKSGIPDFSADIGI